MKQSVWTNEVKLPTFNALEGDKKCHVLIIGGGLCGLLCAYFLKNAGVDYILTEAARIAGGVTQNTTGKITSQHGLIYSDISLTYGKEKAQMYLTANERAIEEYKKLAYNINCNFEYKDAYTYSLKSRGLIEREVKCVEELGKKCSFTKDTELPFEIKGAIRFPRQAQFNPLKFISAIVKDLNIYENTFVTAIEKGTAITPKGKIKADKIVVCTHFPFLNKHGSYFLKLYQHRSYVSAFENVPVLEGMYVDESLSGISLRSYENLLLVGSGGHRTGKTGKGWAEGNKFAKEHYPLSRLNKEWAAQDCITLDKIPYIGKYSKHTPDLYVATGFNKWGMTTSMVAAQIICSMVLGKKSEYEEVFDPGRKIVHPQLFVNGFETALNFLTPIPKRCTHLGCALKWNKYEHTWDCACHGSRFDSSGKVIDNPAMKDLD